jgi:pimeloyl-ACP methyl ester carboxylesterase
VVVAVVAAIAWWVWGGAPATVDPSASVSSPARTVLLIPGHGGGPASLSALQGALASDGWTTQIVDIGDGSGDIAGYARQVADLVGRYADQGTPVSLVGYSMGGLIAREAVASGAAADIVRVATIGTPHNGTSLAGIGALVNSAACDLACQQMAPDSDFLAALPVAGDPARWLAIYSETDDVVRPAETAALEGATVARVQDYCPASTDTHGDIVVDPFTTRAVVAFLDSGVVPSGCP